MVWTLSEVNSSAQGLLALPIHEKCDSRVAHCVTHALSGTQRYSPQECVDTRINGLVQALLLGLYWLLVKPSQGPSGTAVVSSVGRGTRESLANASELLRYHMRVAPPLPVAVCSLLSRLDGLLQQARSAGRNASPALRYRFRENLGFVKLMIFDSSAVSAMHRVDDRAWHCGYARIHHSGTHSASEAKTKTIWIRIHPAETLRGAVIRCPITSSRHAITLTCFP